MVVGCLNSVGGHAVPRNSIQDTDKLLPVAFDTTQVTSPQNRNNPKPGDPCHPLAAGAHPPAIAFTSKDNGGVATEELAPTLRSMGHAESHANGGGQLAIAIQERAVSENIENGPGGKGFREGVAFTIEARAKVQAVAFQPRIARNGRGQPEEVCSALSGAQSGETSDSRPVVATFQQSSLKGKGTLGYDESGIAKPCKTQQDGQMIQSAMAVRRLTPHECARLQGFPDDWTAIPWRGKPASECPDGPQYKAYGNSMATNCMRWIGRRIQQIDAHDPTP